MYGMKLNSLLIKLPNKTIHCTYANIQHVGETLCAYSLVGAHGYTEKHGTQRRLCAFTNHYIPDYWLYALKYGSWCAQGTADPFPNCIPHKPKFSQDRAHAA